MGQIIAICNQKGGVGKTTTCVNLSAALGMLENKVLVIDTDPQANASVSFGFSSKTLNNPALQQMEFVSVIKNNVVKTQSPNVDLLPYFEDLNLFKRTNDTSKFNNALKVIRNLYDYVVIDCVPFFKTKNLDILISSDSVIIPVQCDYYALEGLHQFLKTIRFVQKNLNKSLDIEGFLLTMFDQRLNLSKKVANYMRDYFKDFVFDTVIHRNSKITQAPSFGKSILEYDISSRGAENYLQLANEIIAKNLQPKETREIPMLTEENETLFNKKELSKTSVPETESDRVLEKMFRDASQEYEFKEPIVPKNFDTLLNLNKSYIEKTMGSCHKNLYGNTWIYKINKSSIFKKKYLYLYFKNGVVSHYTTKWFS